MFTTEKTKLINQAFEFAHIKHKDQVEDTGKPYIVHPVQVANILMVITDDENLIAAAALHDTLEDTQTTYQELVRFFNKDIADLVNEVTKDKATDTYPRLKTRRGMMLKFADRLSNISRMETWSEERQQKYLNKSKFWEK